VKSKVDAKLILSHPVHITAFGFGTGLSPVAPGTVGTLVGFPLYYAIFALPVLAQVVILAALFVVGIWVCNFTGNAVDEADHPGIVWDEIVCFALVLVFTPASPLWWIAAFVAFRFFDIFKLWPASWIDNNMKNGLGVMTDDLVAAFYAIAVIQVAQPFFN